MWNRDDNICCGIVLEMDFQGVFIALRYLALTCLDMEDMDFQRIED